MRTFCFLVFLLSSLFLRVFMRIFAQRKRTKRTKIMAEVTQKAILMWIRARENAISTSYNWITCLKNIRVKRKRQLQMMPKKVKYRMMKKIMRRRVSQRSLLKMNHKKRYGSLNEKFLLKFLLYEEMLRVIRLIRLKSDLISLNYLVVFCYFVRHIAGREEFGVCRISAEKTNWRTWCKGSEK